MPVGHQCEGGIGFYLDEKTEWHHVEGSLCFYLEEINDWNYFEGGLKLYLEEMTMLLKDVSGLP